MDKPTHIIYNTTYINIRLAITKIFFIKINTFGILLDFRNWTKPIWNLTHIGISKELGDHQPSFDLHMKFNDSSKNTPMNNHGLQFAMFMFDLFLANNYVFCCFS